MDLAKVLSYQQADAAYFKIEKTLRESEEARGMAMCQKASKAASEELVKLNRRAEEYFSTFEKNAQRYLELKKHIDEAVEVIAGVDDLTEIAYYQKNLEKQLSDLEILEKEVNSINNELESIKKQAETEQKKYNKAVGELKSRKEALLNLKNQLQPEATACLKRLKEMEKDIEPEIMARYKTVREERKKFPVLVELSGTNCGACGMELSNIICDKLNEGMKIAECPHCGRIIYNSK